MNLYECTCGCGCEEVTSDYVCDKCKSGVCRSKVDYDSLEKHGV